MKILHIADIHIRPITFHDEILYTFDRLYEFLDQNSVDVVCIVGDLFHSKLTVSSEYQIIGTNFLKELANRVKTILIVPGNHDCALNNPKRLDAITPIVEAANQKNIHYLKYSETFEIDNFAFHNFSILEKKSKWKKRENLDSSKINIVLYHGFIQGSTLDNDWVSEGIGDDSLDIFDGFDFVLAGDIHKRQFLDSNVAYCGSLRQNSFGEEDIEKGGIIWDIEDIENFSVELLNLPQKRYFFTLYGDQPEDFKGLELPHGSRIRVRSQKQLTLAEEEAIKDFIVENYKPQNEVFIISDSDPLDNKKLLFNTLSIGSESIRKLDIQSKLIKEFLKNQNVSDESIEKVIELDRKYHSHIDIDSPRNVLWKFKKIKWKNAFAYGPINEFDFTKDRGIIGIFGETGIGKSSFLDVLSLAVFNKINKKGANKSIHYINSRKKNMEIDLLLEMNNVYYSIIRSFKKIKTKKDEYNLLTEIKFDEIKDDKKENKLGEDKNHTNNIIQSKFGDLNDFNTISSLSQFGLTNFIDSGGTNRKKALARYFDLDIFDEKFKFADEDSKDIKRKIKELEDLELEKKEEKLLIKLEENKILLSDQELKNKYSKEKLFEFKVKLHDLESSLLDDVEIKDISFIEKKLEAQKLVVEECDSRLKRYKEGIKLIDPNLSFDLILAEKDRLNEQKRSLEREINEYKSNKKKTIVLNTIPCGDSYPLCPFIKEAHEAKLKIDNDFNLDLYKDSLDSYEKQLKKLDSKISSLEKKELLEKEIKKYNLKLKQELDKLESIQKEYDKAHENRENIEKNKIILDQIKEAKEAVLHWQRFEEKTSSDIRGLEKESGQLATEEKLIKDKQKQLTKLRDEYYIYKLYLLAMGKNGISYSIIANSLPQISKEINKILQLIVPFKVVIENNEEEKRIDIFFKDSRGLRPLELASGGEKTIVTLALMTVLWNVSSLPKSPILFLDESLVFLDDKLFDSIVNVLEYMKNYFTHIFLITHNNDLKAICDVTKYVKRDEKGFSYIGE